MRSICARAGAALGSQDAIASDAALLVHWLESSWRVVAAALDAWTPADLAWTYRQEFEGALYQVSRQWVLWRVLSHDLHHGGELALNLGCQGIALPDLGDSGGHIIVPPLAADVPPESPGAG